MMLHCQYIAIATLNDMDHVVGLGSNHEAMIIVPSWLHNNCMYHENFLIP